MDILDKSASQGLKPVELIESIGTTKVVPFHERALTAGCSPIRSRAEH